MTKKKTMRALALILIYVMLLPLAACKAPDSGGGSVVMISLIYDENSPYKPADGGSSAPAPTGNGGRRAALR